MLNNAELQNRVKKLVAELVQRNQEVMELTAALKAEEETTTDLAANADEDMKRIEELESMGNHIIANILTDSQLDTRLPCGQTIRKWKAKLENKSD